MNIDPIPIDHSSSGIAIPSERSIKQRQYAYCANPQCAVGGKEFTFEVEHSYFCCPKCGANKPPLVGMLAKIHLMVQDRNGTFEGIGGLRYRIACDTAHQREHVSTLTNHEMGTADRTVCNCQDCLAATDPSLQKTGLLIIG
jgi:hypothetical protein